MMKTLSLMAALLTAPVLFAAPAPAQSDTMISAEQLRSDLADWQDWLFSTHPDPAFSMNVGAVEAEFAAIAHGLDGTYSRREAWLSLARLNPDFADGHVVIRLPQADYDAYLAAGGADFTLPVTIHHGHLFVSETVAPDSAFDAGAEILRINDRPVADILEAALERTHGDAPALQAFIIEQRLSQYLWALTGGADSWRVEVRTADGDVETRRLDPDRDQADMNSARWRLEIDGDAAILTLNTFRPEFEAEFAAFIEPAFARIAEAGSDVLVIDISHNGGGAHQLSDRLFAYLTDTRYTPISAVTARITPENQPLVPGSQLGQVISLPFAQWVEPPAQLENRFEGDVAFLVGAGTYSQAIVTAAIAQDFQIAPVAGVPTAGRANSTGQVQMHTLAQSGLQVGAPIYVFTRASGDISTDPVMPDIPLSGTRDEQIDALIAHLRHTR